MVAGPAFASEKQEAVNQLMSLKQDNHRKLREVDTRVRSLLNTHKEMDLEEAATSSKASRAFKAFEGEMEVLMAQRKERILRQDFLDRLLFQIDSKYGGGDLRDFLQNTLLEMSLTEATSPAGESPLWRFLTYLSLAIKTLPERNENILSFVEGYMEFSTLSHPVRPDQFVSLRHYTNGATSLPGRPVDKAEVGDAVEAKLLRLEKQKVLEQATKKFEERQPLLKSPTLKADVPEPEKENPELTPHPEEQPDVEMRYRLSEEFQLMPQAGEKSPPSEVGNLPPTGLPEKFAPQGAADELKVELIPKKGVEIPSQKEPKASGTGLR